MSCPVLDGVIEKEIKIFCNLGCSAICDQLLREFIEKKIKKTGNLKGQVSFDI